MEIINSSDGLKNFYLNVINLNINKIDNTQTVACISLPTGPFSF